MKYLNIRSASVLISGYLWFEIKTEAIIIF